MQAGFHIALFAGLSIVLASLAHAQAQVSITQATYRMEAAATATSGDATDSQSEQDSGSFTLVSDRDSLEDAEDFSLLVQASEGGVQASGAIGINDASVFNLPAADGTNPVSGFSMWLGASAARGGLIPNADRSMEASAAIDVTVVVSVTGGDAELHISGLAEAITSGGAGDNLGAASVNLSGGPAADLLFDVETRISPDRNDVNLNHSAIMSPGTYTIEMRNRGVSPVSKRGTRKGQGFAEDATAIIQISLGVSAVDAPDAEIYFWEGLDGSFEDETNWEPRGVPGAGDTAVFDKDQSYVVGVGTAESSRARVERGEVWFFDGSYTLAGGSPGAPSLVVGNDAADSPELTLASGHTLNSPFAMLGKSAAANGAVSLSPLGSPSAWRVDGRLTIGESGPGRVDLGENGRLNAGEVLLGNQADGGGTLHAGSNGTGAEPSAVFTSMAVGVHGTGMANVAGDAIFANTMVLGLHGGSEGLAFVSGESALLEAGHLTLGDGGGASLWANGGAWADWPIAALVLGVLGLLWRVPGRRPGNSEGKDSRAPRGSLKLLRKKDRFARAGNAGVWDSGRAPSRGAVADKSAFAGVREHNQGV